MTIIIEQDGWHYKKNQLINIPIMAGSEYHAWQKIERYNGSEYPSYKLLSCIKCDDGLFKPML